MRLWTAVRVNSKRRATWLDQVVAESAAAPRSRSARVELRRPGRSLRCNQASTRRTGLLPFRSTTSSLDVTPRYGRPLPRLTGLVFASYRAQTLLTTFLSSRSASRSKRLRMHTRSPRPSSPSLLPYRACTTQNSFRGARSSLGLGVCSCVRTQSGVESRVRAQVSCVTLHRVGRLSTRTGTGKGAAERSRSR